jgi:3-isopropylmalate dehydrogenase
MNAPATEPKVTHAKILLLPGDGIGPEVTKEADKLIRALAGQYGLTIELETDLIGGAALDATGEPLPADTLAKAREADAVVLGAVGGPQWDDPDARKRPEQGLLQLRQELKLFANLRPVRLHPSLAHISPLKAEHIDNVDMMVVRELTGGSYFGEKDEGSDEASDEYRYTREEIERVVTIAGDMARARYGKVTMIDKANVLATSRLWRRVTAELMARRYPDVAYETMLVDSAAMHIVANPSRFNVIVTENMFGDILTDEASVLVGSMGMLPSASLGEGKAGLYEPIHGSAPDIAGRKLANPFGMLASVGMLFEYSLGQREAARQVELAIWNAISEGQCTLDIGGNLRTDEAGDAVIAHLGDIHARKVAFI